GDSQTRGWWGWGGDAVLWGRGGGALEGRPATIRVASIRDGNATWAVCPSAKGCVMTHRVSAGLIALAALALTAADAQAFDESRYPEWDGQWTRPHGLGKQWVPSRPGRR